jgi:Cu(I)/Ag(I) efflux system periplasmic protein CusF
MKPWLAPWLTAAAVAAVTTAQAQPAVDGEVTKVDKPAARVTLKHAGIAHLDMPPMTLAFRVADPKLLDGLATGDKVRFSATRVNGAFTITAITKRP